jgi:hypothetical protein
LIEQMTGLRASPDISESRKGRAPSLCRPQTGRRIPGT